MLALGLGGEGLWLKVEDVRNAASGSEGSWVWVLCFFLFAGVVFGFFPHSSNLLII